MRNSRGAWVWLQTYPNAARRGLLTAFLVLRYVNKREARNRTPTVPRSIPTSGKYASQFGQSLLFPPVNLILQPARIIHRAGNVHSSPLGAFV